jgi:nicotinamidase-related amidase
MTTADILIDRDKTALLLVDLQPDFMPGGALPVEGGDLILSSIRDLMERDLFGAYVATQDWLPPAHNLSRPVDPESNAAVHRDLDRLGVRILTRERPSQASKPN